MCLPGMIRGVSDEIGPHILSPFVFASPKGRDVALCEYFLEPRVEDKLLFTCLDKLSKTEIGRYSV